MSKETIELLKILKDETQSRSVFDRCEAELASLKWTEPSPNAQAWNTTVAGRYADVQIIRGGEEVRIK